MLGIFLDQETSGLDSLKHRVLEIAYTIVDLATGESLATYDAIIAQPQEVWAQRDPKSIAINGFRWDMLCTGKSEQQVREDIIATFKRVGIQRGKSVFICQNPSFDRVFFSQIIDPYAQERLFWPYHWLDFASMYWALEIQRCTQSKEPIPDELKLSKDSIAKAKQLPSEDRPHRAINGVRHLLLCYTSVVGFPGRAT